MPQLDFFFCEKERNEILEFAFKNGCRIVPDLRYDSKQYYIASDIIEYQENGQNSPLLFLINSKYSFYSLELDFFEKEGELKYFIQQRHGGPYIDFFSPIIGERENNIVGPGYIGMYPFYYNGSKKFVPNKELHNIYNGLISFIKTISKKIELTNRVYYIGNCTTKEAKKEKFKLLPIEGRNILDLV